MKIALTGASGQLGSEIQRLFAEKPLGEVFPFPEEKWDLLSPIEMQREIINPISPDIIINCAAYTQVDKAENEGQELAKAVNSTAMHTLSQLCNENHTELIHISTDFVFDGTQNTPYSESDECKPLGVYGQTKWEGEQHVIESCQNYSIFRTSWLYSKEHPSFLTTMLKLAESRNSLNVVVDQVGTPTSAQSLALGLHHYIAQREKAANTIYHFSNQGVTSWYDFAHSIFALWDCKMKLIPIPSSEYPTPAQRPAYSVLSKDKFQKDWNYSIDHWLDALGKVKNRD